MSDGDFGADFLLSPERIRGKEGEPPLCSRCNAPITIVGMRHGLTLPLSSATSAARSISQQARRRSERNELTRVAALSRDVMIPARMNLTPQREFWNGDAVELETVWTLTKRGKVARCVLWSHWAGWELKIDGADILLTQVVRSDHEIEQVAAGWRDAMLAKGWTDTTDITEGPPPPRT